MNLQEHRPPSTLDTTPPHRKGKPSKEEKKRKEKRTRTPHGKKKKIKKHIAYINDYIAYKYIYYYINYYY